MLWNGFRQFSGTFLNFFPIAWNFMNHNFVPQLVPLLDLLVQNAWISDYWPFDALVIDLRLCLNENSTSFALVEVFRVIWIFAFFLIWRSLLVISHNVCLSPLFFCPLICHSYNTWEACFYIFVSIRWSEPLVIILLWFLSLLSIVLDFDIFWTKLISSLVLFFLWAQEILFRTWSLVIVL